MEDRMHIFIASYNRSAVVDFSLKHIWGGWRKRTHVVVRPEQLARYRSVIRDRVDLITLPEGNEGVANAWNYIKEYALEHDIPKIVQMDDDIRSLAYRSGADPDPEKWWRGFKATEQEYNGFWLRMEHDLDKYAHAGIIQRQQLHATKDNLVYNRRVNGIRGFNTEALKNVQVNRTPLMEDFSQSLQLILQGHDLLVYHDWAFDHIGFNTRGGLQGIRTKELQMEAVQQFLKDYPPFTTMTMKRHKSRNNEEWPELRIAWKKAAEWGRDS